MKDHLDSFDDFIFEKKNQVYVTNYTGMAQSAIAGIYTSVLAIAQQIANEKAVRNPNRHNGKIEEVDITRAMNLIFHSDWKKKMKQQLVGQMMNNAAERAGKQDKVSAKKNQRAMGRNLGDEKFNVDIDKSSVRFSDDRTGFGPGSNQ
jgi:hypothetical protein